MRRGILSRMRHLFGEEAQKPYFFEDVFGHRMYANPFDAGVNLSNGLDFAKLAQFGEYALIKTIPPGTIVADLGANIGLFTLLFARAVGPTGSVYAYEPGPISCYLLTKNEANGYCTISARNSAVSDHSGIEELWVSRIGESDNTLVPGNKTQRYPVLTRCVTLDDDLPKDLTVDYIKIDIQGTEYEVLKGMRNVLERSPQVQLLVEWGVEAPYAKEILDFARGQGFSIYECPDDAPVSQMTDEVLFTKYAAYSHVNLLLSRRLTI
jgi:FkbM family methyltransferase